MQVAGQLVSSTPFEAVFGDFVGYIGHHFLIAGSRLERDICKAPRGVPQEGSD